MEPPAVAPFIIANQAGWIMKPTASSFRFSPGHHVFETADEGWLLYEPSGAFVRLRAPADALRALTAFVQDDAAAGEPDAAVSDLLTRFEARGVIERGVPRSRAVEPAPDAGTARRARITGSGPIAAALDRLLETEDGLRADTTAIGGVAIDEMGLDDVDLVIDCAGWLPDTRWRARDEGCRERSIAWHGCYAEGGRFYLGPFFAPDDPSTASYRDVRARRLAAAPYPEGLEGYWRHVEEGQVVTAVDWPNAGGVARIAGALAADVIAWSRGETPPSHGHQLAFDPSTGRWTWHPVLPVPRGLMTECDDLAPFTYAAAG